jgi:hypothetical protein
MAHDRRGLIGVAKRKILLMIDPMLALLPCWLVHPDA